MLFYTLDYVIEKVKQQQLTPKHTFLKNFTASEFSKTEADQIYERIADHKWYISERLKRDVGVKVAAIDYFENFYESKNRPAKSGGVFSSTMKVY